MWYSYHLYSQHHFDLTIIYVLKPLRDYLINEGLLEKYFFIRYSDQKGPHIRLRIYHRNSTLSKKILASIIAISNQYDHQYTIEEVTYSQEVIRYGGEKGMLLSETFFQFSSEAAISHICHVNQVRSYNQVMNSTLKYGLAVLIEFKLSKSEIVDFSLQYLNEWINSISFRIPNVAGAKEFNLKAFDAQYLSQKANIDFVLNELYDRLNSKDEVDDALLSEWMTSMNSFSKEIEENFNEFKISFYEGEAYKNNPLWRILSHYIHMNNNRLGISNEGEAFNAFLIQKALNIHTSIIVSP